MSSFTKTTDLLNSEEAKNCSIFLTLQVSKFYLCEKASNAAFHLQHPNLILSEEGLKGCGATYNTTVPKKMQYKKKSEKTPTMHYYRDSQLIIMNCYRSLVIQSIDQAIMTTTFSQLTQYQLETHIPEQGMPYPCDTFELFIFVVVGLSGHSACLLASSSYNSAKASCRKEDTFQKSTTLELQMQQK